MILHPLYVGYHTHSMYNIIYNLQSTTSRFYAITPHYLWHHMHCIYDITPTISEMASTVSGSSQRLYWWSQTNSRYDITPTLRMQLMHSTQRHVHSLWLQTIVIITLHSLHSWLHTPYIWHHTHRNTNVISAIWPAISNTTSTVSVSSKTGYQL